MEKVTSAMAKCPPRYLDPWRAVADPRRVHAQLAAVRARRLEGCRQQLAHTFPQDDVYYEDMAHLVSAATT